MASDSDKSLSNHNLDGSLKSNKKQNSSGNIGDSGDKNILGQQQSLVKVGRHLSLPFDSAATNGDISKCISETNN
ncbi:jg9975 [Pararge aegeria aegeria]|uniref:Jg9975 protein n=1 Tax=Pararge aegeria aegeria TaxID=348720 RepID=A0A8S4SCQ4_9NEOP|nr:jg9975 [Pararge aegeria aegeria]